MGYFATSTSKESHSKSSASSQSGSGSGEESKSKSSTGIKSGSQSSSSSQYSSSSQSGSKSQSGTSSQFSSSGPKSQDNASKSHVKSKEEAKQEKHIFERIAAGENVNGSFLAKNPPPSKAAQVKDGSQTHGHVLRAGHYRYSPGFQQVRHGYQEKKNKEGIKSQEVTSQKASSIKSTTQAKKMTSDEAINKPAKSDEHSKSNKGSEKPLFGTLSERKPKVSASDKSLKKTSSDENKSSNKQQQTSKSHEEKSHH